MCGILGLVAPVGGHVKLDRDRIEFMRDTMTSRGPDGAGLFEHRNVALASRLLAIRADAAAGQQPLVSPDGACALVYNGEIYNNDELRAELQYAGFTFDSPCDTATVLAAYQHWGEEFVKKLRGMFALGIYDFRNDSLLLARDRCGMKPLFLAEIDGVLVFASTVRAIIEHPGYNRRPHWPAVSHYITTGRNVLHRETLFEGIRQLLPAEVLQWRSGNVQLSTYWDYPDEIANAPSYEEATQLLQQELAATTQLHLASQQPAGLFLSGGLDSSTLACMLSEQNTPAGVGYGTDDPGSDGEFAAKAAAHAGLPLTAVEVTQEQYLETWQWMITETATPLGTPSDVIIYHLSQAMKQQTSVVLGGEGADELLGGYPATHWAGHDYARSLQLASGEWPGGEISANRFRESMTETYGRAEFASEVDFFFNVSSFVPARGTAMLMKQWASEKAERESRMWTHYAARLAELSHLPPLRKYMVLLHQINLEHLLRRLDTATMLAGLESRVPFCDHVLMEKMWQLPDAYKLDTTAEDHLSMTASDLHANDALRSKRLLRSVAAGMLPAELANRRKVSFTTPVEYWLHTPWRDWMQHKLTTSPFAKAVFNEEPLTGLTEAAHLVGMLAWPVVNIVLWGDWLGIE